MRTSYLTSLVLVIAFGLLQAMPTFSQTPQGDKTVVQGNKLTVFSEAGERFFLILDGERQNDKPKARVQVASLSRPYYKGRIIFEDDKLKEVDQLMQLEGVDPGYNDVTYVVKKKTRKGRTYYVASGYSFLPISPAPKPGVDPEAEQDPTPEGIPATDPILKIEPTVEPTPNIGPEKKPKHIIHKVYEPDHMVIHPSKEPKRMPKPAPAPAPKPAPTLEAMNMTRFNSNIAAITSEAFENTKLTMAKIMLKNNALSTPQLATLIGAFSFESNKLELAKLAYPKLTDKDSFTDIMSAFSFTSSKEELMKLVK
jgi:hypothetical protein